MHLKPPVRSCTLDAEYRASVEAAAAADQAPHEPPVANRAARDVARAEHEVSVGGRVEQVAEVPRVVREVGVHLDHELGAAGERAREAGEIGLAETVLTRLGAEPRRTSVLRREPVRDRAGAVR